MTAKDEELQILTNVIGDGWPEILAQACEFDRPQKQVIEVYWNWRDELTTDDLFCFTLVVFLAELMLPSDFLSE